MRFGGEVGTATALPHKYENDFGGVIDERSEKQPAKLVVCTHKAHKWLENFSSLKIDENTTKRMWRINIF